MNQNDKTMPAAKSGGRRFKNDIILIGVLLLALLLVGGGVLLFQKPGDVVVVTVDGSVMGTYSLLEDLTLPIHTGEGGEQVNVLVIKDGEAYVQSASCPDGICAAHKPISRQGESIVCLPHRVVVTVQCTEQQNAPDIVT
jgi:hypothetical protein